jgi:uncharacterized protein
MHSKYLIHNQFISSMSDFGKLDPHLSVLAKQKFRHQFDWWKNLSLTTTGIYILTGGRQVGKSTSCKQLIQTCLKNKDFAAKNILYLPCDEIFNAKELSQTIRLFLEQTENQTFLLVIDEITFVKDWDRVIKALADEGQFQRGLCLLTGSDSLILKQAAMRFPGRRGTANKTDFHLYPLSFAEYVKLTTKRKPKPSNKKLLALYQDYLQCGGYLRAINDLASLGKINESTLLTYEQWLRGDFLQRGKNEDTLLAILSALINTGVSQISYSKLTQKIGLISKETCIDYCRLLERMDVLFNLQAFDQNKKQGFPRKDRKFHFVDPFIYNVIVNWLIRDGQQNAFDQDRFENTKIEASVASCARRFNKTFYFKGQGEVDVVTLKNNKIYAIEVKWAQQVRSSDLKMLKQFKNSFIVTKSLTDGTIEHIKHVPICKFLFDFEELLS